jgi:hypothetical protein
MPDNSSVGCAALALLASGFELSALIRISIVIEGRDEP